MFNSAAIKKQKKPLVKDTSLFKLEGDSAKKAMDVISPKEEKAPEVAKAPSRKPSSEDMLSLEMKMAAAKKKSSVDGEQFKSESAKLVEKGFRKLTPLNQIEASTTLNKITPVSQEYRDRPSNTKRVPIEQEIKNKEYEEEIKKLNKLRRDRTV